MRDHARLARPRAREDEQCAVDVFDGGSLFGVEGGEEVQASILP